MRTRTLQVLCEPLSETLGFGVNNKHARLYVLGQLNANCARVEAQ
jgi:hypothetical protein